MKRNRSDFTLFNDGMLTKGFYIIPSFCIPQYSDWEVLKNEIRSQKNLDPIFNGGMATNTMAMTMSDREDMSVQELGDQKRFQLGFKDGKGFCDETKKLIDCIRNVLCKIVDKRLGDDFVFLLSEAGCAEQTVHTDFDPNKKYNDDGIAQGYPLGCLLALESGTKLVVWPGSNNFDTEKTYLRTEVTLNAGDVLLFRADLLHAGAAYDQSNIRVHCFLDRRAYKRTENKTYRMDEYNNVLF